jgi:hypothetical protein
VVIAGFRMVLLPLKVIDGSLQVRRVPKNDGGHEQIKPARAVIRDDLLDIFPGYCEISPLRVPAQQLLLLSRDIE